MIESACKITKTFKQSKDIKYLIMLSVIAILLIMGMFGNTSYFAGHDSKYHLSVIVAYEKQIDISEGILFPEKILPEIAKDLGYGTGIFYPQLPHLTAAYICKIIGVVGFDEYCALKITHSLALILSSITTYFLALKISENRKIALISSIILLVTPFRISEILIRDAFAECFTYIFIPMILLGIFELIDKNYKKFMWLFTIGYIGMFLSHQVLTIYITILLIPILIFYIRELLNKKTIIYAITSILIIIILVLPSIFPMLYHKINGNYVVFDGDAMGGYEKISKHSLAISDLILPTNSGNITSNTVNSKINFNINIIVIMLCGITVIFFRKMNFEKQDKKRIYAIIIAIGISLFMATELFPWKIMPEFMYMLQFPWRLLTVSGIAISVFAPICLKKYENDKNFNIICIVIVGLILAAGIETISYHYSKNIDNKDGIDVEYSGMGHQSEYLPVKTLENYEYFEGRNKEIIIQSGNAIIEKTFDETPKLEFSVKEINIETKIELPRLFYFGYTLTNKTTGEKIKIYENENGFISAEIDSEGEYTLEYEEIAFIKTYRIVMWVIIVLSLISCSIYTIKKRKRRN